MIHAEMVHSGTVLGRVLAHASEVGKDQGSITVLAHVTEGEQVWVRNIDNDDLGLSGSLYSLFSGCLLMATLIYL